MALTALVLVLAVRGGLHPGHRGSGWLLQANFLLDGWRLTAVNVALYAYVCWLAFWFIRSTEGRERAMTVGWFIGILLSPLKTLLPEGALAVRYIEILGLAVAMLASLSLLAEPSRHAPPRNCP